MAHGVNLWDGAGNGWMMWVYSRFMTQWAFGCVELRCLGEILRKRELRMTCRGGQWASTEVVTQSRKAVDDQVCATSPGQYDLGDAVTVSECYVHR